MAVDIPKVSLPNITNGCHGRINAGKKGCERTFIPSVTSVILCKYKESSSLHLMCEMCFFKRPNIISAHVEALRRTSLPLVDSLYPIG